LGKVDVHNSQREFGALVCPNPLEVMDLLPPTPPKNLEKKKRFK
jgi:hypothetical protein